MEFPDNLDAVVTSISDRQLLVNLNANMTDVCQQCKLLIGVGNPMVFVKVPAGPGFRPRKKGASHGVWRMHPGCV